MAPYATSDDEDGERTSLLWGHHHVERQWAKARTLREQHRKTRREHLIYVAAVTWVCTLALFVLAPPLGLTEAVVAERREGHRWSEALRSSLSLVALSTKEHLKEVHAVSWNLVNKDSFLSASWDGQVKHWSPASPQSLATWRLPAQGSVYSVAWSPRWASTFATGSQDKMLKVSCSVYCNRSWCRDH